MTLPKIVAIENRIGGRGANQIFLNDIEFWDEWIVIRINLIRAAGHADSAASAPVQTGVVLPSELSELEITLNDEDGRPFAWIGTTSPSIGPHALDVVFERTDGHKCEKVFLEITSEKGLCYETPIAGCS